MLDRSHKQKIEEISTSVKDQELIMRVHFDGRPDLGESAAYRSRGFLEEIFSIRPVLKKKKQK